MTSRREIVSWVLAVVGAAVMVVSLGGVLVAILYGLAEFSLTGATFSDDTFLRMAGGGIVGFSIGTALAAISLWVD